MAADLDLRGLKRAARAADPLFLSGAFTYQPAGSPRQIAVGPSNPDFVAIGDLPPHVVRAVTTSEDAGFFSHHGFDFQELKNALAEGAEAGRVVRGASTITQQLAKNLFLSRERTLARKAREALLTLALEASLPKARLLEIYLNVAEWGPGVYGIGEAARHWFGKDARTLTPREAAFLASIIPGPVRYHAWYYRRGEVSDGFRAHVDGLLRRMRDQGQLTDRELLEALEQPIVFARG
jgi:penicillin-binding protein 1A